MQQLLNRLMVELMPLVPKAWVWPFAQSYVAGESIEAMLDVVRSLNAEGCRVTVDILGEFVASEADARYAAEKYQQLLNRLHEAEVDAGVSVKLTQLGLLLHQTLAQELMGSILSTAQDQGRFVRIDMEDSACTTKTIEVYRALKTEFNNVGVVLQAYLRRTQGDAEALVRDGLANVRLCKGIYVEPRAIAYKTRELINANYGSVLETLLTGGQLTAIATHDEMVVWHALKLIRDHQIPPDRYEFQMLLGVDEPLRNILIDAGHPVRVYVPYGDQWHAYCFRRFKENPTLAQYVVKNLFH